MYNYFMLVGVLVSDIEIREVASGKRVANILLKVKRDFKNQDGDFSYDTIRVVLWELNAEIASDNLKKGDKVGIKGRISPRREQHAEGFMIQVNELVAERIIFFENLTKEKNIDVEDEYDISNQDE